MSCKIPHTNWFVLTMTRLLQFSGLEFRESFVRSVYLSSFIPFLNQSFTHKVNKSVKYLYDFDFNPRYIIKQHNIIFVSQFFFKYTIYKHFQKKKQFNNFAQLWALLLQVILRNFSVFNCLNYLYHLLLNDIPFILSLCSLLWKTEWVLGMHRTEQYLNVW